MNNANYKMNKEKIAQHFGAEFLDKLQAILEKYSSLWQLSNIEQIDYYSVNCIFACTSVKYGACILKVSQCAKNMASEYNALKDFSGSAICKVYQANIDDGVMLIEQITPGTQLRNETDLDTRLDVFCGIFSNLHTIPSDMTKYQTYMDWVSHVAEYMRSPADFNDFSEKMTKAESICRVLWQKYPAQMLLHGDLHHDNIILGEQSYLAIDPKGVVGNPIFDIPRFMLNEDDMDKNGKFDYIVRTLSKNLGISEQDIRSLYYIETCMENCWNIENGGEVCWEDVLFAESVVSGLDSYHL